MDVLTVLHDYGWAGVLLLLLVEKTGPFLGRYFNTEQSRRARAEDAERKRLCALEERQVAAWEQVAAALRELSPILATMQTQINGVSGDTKIMLVQVGQIKAALDKPTVPRRKAGGDG